MQKPPSGSADHLDHPVVATPTARGAWHGHFLRSPLTNENEFMRKHPYQLLD